MKLLHWTKSHFVNLFSHDFVLVDFYAIRIMPNVRIGIFITNYDKNKVMK